MKANPQTYFEARKFNCRTCGGQLAYAPDKDRLVCVTCHQEQAIEAQTQQYVPFSYEQHKGAPDETVTMVTGLAPFRFTAQQAAEKVESWLRQEGVAQDTPLRPLEAIYLPFYLFKMNATATYHAKRGDNDTEKRQLRGLRDAAGNTLEQRGSTTRWSSKDGTVSLPREAIPVMAAKTLPNKFVGALNDWNFAELRPFDEAYLAGFKAQRPQLDLNAVYKTATTAGAAYLQTAARKQIGGDKQELIAFAPEFSDATFQLILLPVFVGTFTQNGTTYPFAVNGYSGKVAGDAPDTLKKKTKRWLSYMGMAAVATVIYVGWMLLNDYEYGEIIGLPLMLGSMVGVFLLFIWLAEKLHILLLTLLYVLTLMAIGYGLLLITGSSTMVIATEAILIVLGLILLPAFYFGNKDEKSVSGKVTKKKSRLPS